MGTMPLDAANQPDPRLDRVFVERERNRFGSRALSSLVLLNGAAALVLLAILGSAPGSSVDSKVSVALMFLRGGAVAALRREAGGVEVAVAADRGAGPPQLLGRDRRLFLFFLD